LTKPTVASPLSIWIVLEEGRAPDPGPLRLMSGLHHDPRYRIAAILRAPSVPPLSVALGWLLRVEAGLRPASTAPKAEAWGCKDIALSQASTLAEDPDVIIDFTMNPEVLSKAGRARHGLWRLDAFDPMAGLAATFDAAPTAGVRLYLAQGNQCRVLAQAMYDTKPLAARTQAYLREKSVQLILRELGRLARDGVLVDGPLEGIETPQAPGAGVLAGYGARIAGQAMNRLRMKLGQRLGATPRQFRLILGRGTLDDFDPASATDITPRPRTYWADPFLFSHDDTLWCFFEEYDYRTGLGQIAVGRVSDTRIDYVGPALTAPHHLSFPNVFRHGADIFMIPETNATRRIEVWRATDFPTGWSLHATALEGVRAADTLLVLRNGDWWLFTNICNDSFGDFCSDLSVFCTSGPDLAWLVPHALNPVIIGSDRARNAGRVVERDGRLFRLAQDNSGGVYGYALKVMEIDELGPDRYGERCVRHITPDFRPGLIGCHHFDAADGRFVMDVRRP